MKNLKMSLLMASLSLVVRLAAPALGNNWNDEWDPNAGAPVGPAWELSILGGLANPIGDNPHGFSGDYKSSALFQASIIRNISPDIGIGLETGYSLNHELDFHLDPYTQYAFNPKDSVQITQLTPVLQIGKWFGQVKPYVTLGGGLYHVRETLSLDDPYY